MRQQPLAWNRANLMRATCRSREYFEDFIKKAERAELDTDRVARVDAQECRWCFYFTGRIGCAAITERPCGCCGTAQSYGNTCTDALCVACAKAHQLCKHCAGDIDMRDRRRNWPV